MGPKKQSVTSVRQKGEREGGGAEASPRFTFCWSGALRDGQEENVPCEMPLNGPSVPCLRGALNAKREKGEKRKGTPRNKLTMQRPRFALTVFQGGGDGDPIRQRVYPLRGGSGEAFLVCLGVITDYI
jgi:hypothetical protein